MAPILIDKQGQIKLGLIFFVMLILVFTVGFFSGHRFAETSAGVAAMDKAHQEVLSLPAVKSSDNSNLSEAQPEALAAGANIDVDRPEAVTSSKTINLKTVKSESSQLLKNKNTDTAKSTETIATKKKLKAETVKHRQTVTDRTEIKKSSSSKQANQQVAMEDARYSIQVGVYGRYDGALKIADEMNVHQLNAYVTDYVNSKNKTRYNVKFGYFRDKKSALAALEDYRINHQGDGYLVNFTPEIYARHIALKALHEDKSTKTKTEKTSTKISKEAAVNQAATSGNGTVTVKVLTPEPTSVEPDKSAVSKALTSSTPPTIESALINK